MLLPVYGKALVAWITVACSMGFLLFGIADDMIVLIPGYDQGVMSGIIGANNQVSWRNVNWLIGSSGTTLVIPIPISKAPSSQSMSSYISRRALIDFRIGCFFGAMFIFVFGEHLGRRWAIILGGSVMIVGTIIQASAFHVSQIIIGRIVTGLGNGANTATVPIWQSETCMPKERGKLVCIECVILILGVVISYWMDYGFSHVNGPAQWYEPPTNPIDYEALPRRIPSLLRNCAHCARSRLAGIPTMARP
jgi:MFS family permease